MRSFDVVVVGAGPTGEVAAGRLGAAGLDVALVERELVGGECSYWACMPSKALLRPAHALAEASRVPGAAEAVGDVDVPAALARRDEVVRGLDDSAQLGWLERRRVTLVRGHGRLDGERRVRVGDEVLEARRAVMLAPGSGAALPPIEGLEAARPWTNREATLARTPPRRLLVLGGGPVGCELAQAWGSLGSEVVLVEGAPGLLPREEPYAGETLREVLETQGVEVRCGTEATSARRDGPAVVLELSDGASVEGDELLVAVGRSAHTDDLGLETVGLEPGGPVEVGDDLRVAGHDWLYVLGDANGRVLLTHMGKYQARIAADAIRGIARELRVDGATSPRVIFTEPQVAAVGHTLATAQEAGLDARCAEAGTGDSAGASFHGRGVPGTTRLVLERNTGRVLGATFVGADVAEMLHAASIAVSAGLTIDDLFHAIPAFPTRSEVWLRLAADWERISP